MTEQKMNIYEFEAFLKENQPKEVFICPEDNPREEYFCFGSCEVMMYFPEILVSTYNNSIFLRKSPDRELEDYICFADVKFIKVNIDPDCELVTFYLSCGDTPHRYEYALIAVYTPEWVEQYTKNKNNLTN